MQTTRTIKKLVEENGFKYKGVVNTANLKPSSYSKMESDNRTLFNDIIHNYEKCIGLFIIELLNFYDKMRKFYAAEHKNNKVRFQLIFKLEKEINLTAFRFIDKI